MIISQLFYAVKCDNCGDMCEGPEYTYWGDEDNALELAQDSEWYITYGDNSVHLCLDCYNYDDEDNLVIKNKKDV